jgi:hypothetical protein
MATLERVRSAACLTLRHDLSPSIAHLQLRHDSL